MTDEPYVCTVQAAPKIAEWLRERGGLLIWRSVDLSDPGRTMTTPYKGPNGEVVGKPHWSVANEPERHITDAKEVRVAWDREVKRFHVAVRRGAQGLMLKLTDGSSRKVRKEVEKAGEGAYYEFDYGTQEAVIMAPTEVIELGEWERRQGNVR